MKIKTKDFRVRVGHKVQQEWPTITEPYCSSKDDYRDLLRPKSPS